MDVSTGHLALGQDGDGCETCQDPSWIRQWGYQISSHLMSVGGYSQFHWGWWGWFHKHGHYHDYHIISHDVMMFTTFSIHMMSLFSPWYPNYIIVLSRKSWQSAVWPRCCSVVLLQVSSAEVKARAVLGKWQAGPCHSCSWRFLTWGNPKAWVSILK